MLPLDFAGGAGLNPVTRLSPQKWSARLRDYVKLRETKARFDAEARAAKSVADAERDAIIAAMGGTSAICGNMTVSVKKGSDAAASLTLTDGRKVKWSDVTHIRVAGQLIEAGQVASIFGGRSGSTDLVILGG